MRWRWSRAWWILDEAVRSATELAKLRGAEISMIFLEPMAALDPVYTIGAQIAETIAQHEGIGQRGRVIEAIPGAPPNLAQIAPGCAFAARCRHVTETCTRGEIPEIMSPTGAMSRCVRAVAPIPSQATNEVSA